MKNLNVKWYKLLVFLLVLSAFSCKSADPVPPLHQEEEAIELDVSEFADLIRKNSGLIKTIEKNAIEQLSAGLSYAEIEYVGSDNQPMALYILLANLKKDVSLAASAAANGENLNTKETVRKQIEYVTNRGYDVLAAVNGDFWRVNANEQDNTPMGQAYGSLYMNGKMYKDITKSTDYYFAALLKDDSFVIGDKGAYLRAKANIKEAIGGRYLLVKDGKDVSGKISNKEIAPRTSIGEFDAHNVVFIVVDGRRSDHSQGVSMQALGKIYEAIGVNTAINLDGGGSSTLIVKDKAGQLVLENRPSDNSERSVTNSWTIIKK